MYPAGVVGLDVARFSASWKTSASSEDVAAGEVRLEIEFTGGEEVVMLADALRKALKLVDKLGKRKHWPMGTFGHAVDVKVFTEEGKLKGKRWKGKEVREGEGAEGDLDGED